MMEPVNLNDYEQAARERLPEDVFDYFAGGAGDEVTLCENERAFRRIRLWPRVLRTSNDRCFATRLFGVDAALPLVISPTAFHRLAHEEGECATARAAAAHGVVFILSMAATTSLEDVAGALDGADRSGLLWFQLYIQPDRNLTAEFVRRAESAGCSALVVTVDSPVFGRRERDLVHAFHELPDGLSLENFRRGRDGDDAPGLLFEAGLSWKDIAWLRGLTRLPVLLKGILHPADAHIAAREGVDGLIVSNHGGRQLDTVPSTIEALPYVCEAVPDLPVLVDGGIRRGTEVLKAMALGASAVGIGRPVLWGLAVGGERGVFDVLAKLRNELDQAMALCGCTTLADITPGLLRPSLNKT